MYNDFLLVLLLLHSVQTVSNRPLLTEQHHLSRKSFDLYQNSQQHIASIEIINFYFTCRGILGIHISINAQHSVQTKFLAHLFVIKIALSDAYVIDKNDWTPDSNMLVSKLTPNN